MAYEIIVIKWVIPSYWDITKMLTLSIMYDTMALDSNNCGLATKQLNKRKRVKDELKKALTTVMTADQIKKLEDAGVKTAHDLLSLNPDQVIKITGCDLVMTTKAFEAARAMDTGTKTGSATPPQIETKKKWFRNRSLLQKILLLLLLLLLIALWIQRAQNRQWFASLLNPVPPTQNKAVVHETVSKNKAGNLVTKDVTKTSHATEEPLNPAAVSFLNNVLKNVANNNSNCNIVIGGNINLSSTPTNAVQVNDYPKKLNPCRYPFGWEPTKSVLAPHSDARFYVTMDPGDVLEIKITDPKWGIKFFETSEFEILPITSELENGVYCILFKAKNHSVKIEMHGVLR